MYSSRYHFEKSSSLTPGALYRCSKNFSSLGLSGSAMIKSQLFVGFKDDKYGGVGYLVEDGEKF